VLEEDAPDRCTGRLGGDDPDGGQHVVGHGEGPTCGGQGLHDLGLGVGVAGHDDGNREPGLGKAGCVVQQHFGVAAVGATDQQHQVGPAVAQRPHLGSGEWTRGDVGHPGTGAQPDAVTRLGGDVALVSHDGEPQPAAGARAGQHLVDRTVVPQLVPQGAVAVEDVRLDRRRR
jgi:hypothetical protein